MCEVVYFISWVKRLESVPHGVKEQCVLFSALTFFYMLFVETMVKNILRKMKTVCTEILNSIEGLLHVNKTVPMDTGETCILVFTVTQSFRKGATF